MGLLDKVKGILFDEEEIEIPEIKKESKKSIKNNNNDFLIEEENPIKEIKVPKDDFKDKEYKSETTFTFPIDFEEDETIKFEEIDVKPKEEKHLFKEPKETDKRVERDFSSFLSQKIEKKKFKPTPIISPVYGVLDQNYKKEDVIVKNDPTSIGVEPTLDMVRKKAFGSLEDDLEENLTNTKEMVIEEEIKVKKTKKALKSDTVEEPVDKKKTIGELINEEEHSLDIPDIDGINEETIEYNSDSDITEPVDIVKDSDADIDDEEADLFSLIDSMYEEKGE